MRILARLLFFDEFYGMLRIDFNGTEFGMKQKDTKNHNKILRIFVFMACIVMMLVFAVPAFAHDANAPAKAATLSVTVAYAITSAVALLLVLAYLIIVRKKNIWIMLLSVTVFVVNFGYFMLASSKTLETAVFANSVSYFGSVFLAFFMLMIILNVCGISCPKKVVGILICLAFLMFLLASSSGYSDLYYKDITITFENGMAKLVKEYGPLHGLYPVYLLGYFGAMVGVIVYATVKKKFRHFKYAAILAWLVLGNIGIWLVEQGINWDFEFLSVSYLITELLLFFLYELHQDYKTLESSAASPSHADIPQNNASEVMLPSDIEELFVEFENRVKTLTPTERTVLQYYIDGCSLEEIAEKSYISINTAKKHNTNLNKKLGISSRDELQLYIELFRRGNRLEEISYSK